MKPMKLGITALAAIALLGLFACRSRAELSALEARQYLKAGALVVDVRTVAEYNTKHLTNVINIPLDEVKQKFPNIVTNKSDVVLLHCRSGSRSGRAENQLRALGYTNVFNIGSFSQAEKILSDPAP